MRCTGAPPLCPLESPLSSTSSSQLRRIEASGEWKEGKRYKELRRALAPFLDTMAAKFPMGPRRERADRGKVRLCRARLRCARPGPTIGRQVEKLERKRRRDSDKAADARVLNAAKLRAERAKRLQSLLEVPGCPPRRPAPVVLIGASTHARRPPAFLP